MCRLQSEDAEYNGMCCHDGVPLCFRPQRADGCAQTSCYISQPTEKVRQHMEQSGKSNQRYSNLSLCLFLAACLPKSGGHQHQKHRPLSGVTAYKNVKLPTETAVSRGAGM